MTKVVVDASVAVKWFLPEIHSEAAERLLDPELSLCAPDLVLSEIANTLWKKTRRGEIAPQNTSEILIAFSRIPIELVSCGNLVPAALMLANSLDRTVYDTLYLTLAIARSGVFVTADRKFHFAVVQAGLAQYIRLIEEEAL